MAVFLSKALSIPTSLHLSMGAILRFAFNEAQRNPDYAKMLADRYHISSESDIFSCVDADAKLIAKVNRFMPNLKEYFGDKRIQAKGISQLDWLEFCTQNGLLVPDRWTKCFIESRIEISEDIQDQSFILDGYPRTVAAAKHLISYLNRYKIPIIKLLHLSISKQEMMLRAKQRERDDDTEGSLRSRYVFYVENVQPSVDYMKRVLGANKVALIDAHQPVFTNSGNASHFDLQASIANVAMDSLFSMGIPRDICRDLVRQHV
ncbi:MAG: nucleoside monophosphate kinase [Pseudomonadota bacterium]|nr:nucleoside monophosphate kinase [Pseudomonadota bacterium]